MSFATAAARFSQQRAKHFTRREPVEIQPYTGANLTTKDGGPLTVFLSPVRIEREIAENGFITVHRAQLRILKTQHWQPAEGSEFVRTDTGERFRCRTAEGANASSPTEIVCDVVRISP